MASKGSELKAGIVVLLGLLILGLGLFLVSGGGDMFAAKKRYTILFPHAGGTAEGDAVYLAGQKVGSVVDVTTRDVVEDSVTHTYVAVQIEVYDGVTIHRDSEVTVSKTVTGIVTLNIEYGESGERADPRVELRGRKLATFEEAIDNGAKLVAKAEAILARIDGIVGEIDVKGLQGKADRLLDTVQATADDLREIVSNAKEPVEATLASVRSATGRADALVGDVQGDWDRIGPELGGAAGEVHEAAKTVRSIADENRERVKELLQGLVDGSKRIGPVLERAESLLRDANETILEARPQLTGGLRSARTGLDSFKAAAEDLKSHPWKLVNKPSEEESDAVHLYNAAGRYVASVEEIRVVVEELDALREAGALQEGNDARVQDALRRLEESLRKFDESQDLLVRRMTGGTVKAKN